MSCGPDVLWGYFKLCHGISIDDKGFLADICFSAVHHRLAHHHITQLALFDIIAPISVCTSAAVFTVLRVLARALWKEHLGFAHPQPSLLSVH